MRHVTIIGGGFAGVVAARKAVEEGATVTPVDRHGHHDLLPRLAPVAAGAGQRGDGWMPLDDIINGDVVVGDVREIAVTGEGITLTDGRILQTDAVVVATGAASAWPDVPDCTTTPSACAPPVMRCTSARDCVAVPTGWSWSVVAPPGSSSPGLPVTSIPSCRSP